MSQASRRRKPQDLHRGADDRAGDLRIIGGKFRGSKLSSEPFIQATGDTQGELVTRPMKHRVREAIFNLVGLDAKGKHAIDVFAGTGALGLEAISRGATSATFIERHVPTGDVVRRNIEALGLQDSCELLIASAFVWSKRDLPKPDAVSKANGAPWLMFVSPPYVFFVDRQEEMLALVKALIEHAPAGSVIVVESDERFDFGLLPGGVRTDRHSDGWDVRPYSPAVVGVWRKAD